MDVIRMYGAVEQMRNYIWIFNLNYGRQKWDIYRSLVPFAKEIWEAGISDLSYWKNTEVDPQKLYDLADGMEKAVESKDIVFLYDLLNYEIRHCITDIFTVLFEKDSEVLERWFWDENRKALKERYPEILDRIDNGSDGKDGQNVREYGLRGRVVFRKDGDAEADLYTAYNPGEIGIWMAQDRGFSKYGRIYVWGFDGAYELSGGRFYFDDGKTELELFVTDLTEFRQILMHTMRKGFLLNPDVNWNFDCSIGDFIKSIDLKKKEVSYIYITEYSEKDMEKLKEFIDVNGLDSNIGAFTYGHFIV